MKHKHYDMIMAKAENMDLVVFCNHETEGWKAISGSDYLPHYPDSDYFLCLPQHKEACLHWLNGGEIEYKSKGYWRSSKSWPEYAVSEFGAINYFTSEDSEARIKPKKEKIWVAYHKNGFMFNEVGGSMSDIDDRVKSHELSDFVESDWQYKEIEVTG